MEVKEYRDAQAFLEDYEAVMLEQEAVSQLVLYSAYHSFQNQTVQNDNANIDNTAVFGAVTEDDKVILLFADVIPYNLDVYVVKQEKASPASAALADYLGKNHIAVNGIVAVNDVCSGFMEVYKKLAGISFRKKLGIDIMELRKVNELIPIEGSHRLADPSEAKLVAEWMIEFQMESLESEMDYEAALKRAEKLINEKKIYFYEDMEQKVVTMAVAARKLVHGTAITYIFTPEEHRGKGYAAANIFYLSKELLEQNNDFCTVFVDKKNPLSGRAYEKVGYKTVGDIYEYNIIPKEI